jgi:sugar lactone lactonase YvrE
MESDAVACTAEQSILGEGVRWDARRDELLRVDILAGRVYRDGVDDDGALVPVRAYQVPGTVGAIAPVQGDEGWLLAAGRGFVHLSPDGSLRLLAEVAPSEAIIVTRLSTRRRPAADTTPPAAGTIHKRSPRRR